MRFLSKTILCIIFVLQMFRIDGFSNNCEIRGEGYSGVQEFQEVCACIHSDVEESFPFSADSDGCPLDCEGCYLGSNSLNSFVIPQLVVLPVYFQISRAGPQRMSVREWTEGKSELSERFEIPPLGRIFRLCLCIWRL